MTTIDTSQVRQLAAQLAKAGPAVVPAAERAVTLAAAAVQKDMRAAARGHRRFRSFPSSITTDQRRLTAEVGPDKRRRQGALGNVLYFGTANNGPVLPHPSESLEAGAQVLAKTVAGIAVESVTYR